MTPVERAARALFEYEPGPYGDCVEWAIEQDFGWRAQVDAVKLVLTAVREPSAAMDNAGKSSEFGERPYPGGEDGETLPADITGIWQAMIDAALEEGT